MAACTRALVAGDSFAEEDMTRETVACETPASSATSRLVTIAVSSFLVPDALPHAGLLLLVVSD